MVDAAGVKSTEIAEKLGVTRATVSRWRAGTRRMDDGHYQALVELATGSETQFLMIHRLAQQPGGVASSEDRTLLLSVHTAPDYQAKFVQSFRFQLQKLVKLASGDPQDWDYQALKFYAQDVHGMASALAVIMGKEENGGA